MLLFSDQIKFIKKNAVSKHSMGGGLLGKSEINLGLIMRFLVAHSVKNN